MQDFVGWLGLKFEIMVCIDMDYYDFGYWFRWKYWGQGIVMEIFLVVLDYGFEMFGLEEVFVGVYIENIGFNKVL